MFVFFGTSILKVTGGVFFFPAGLCCFTGILSSRSRRSNQGFARLVYTEKRVETTSDMYVTYHIYIYVYRCIYILCRLCLLNVECDIHIIYMVYKRDSVSRHVFVSIISQIGVRRYDSPG